MFEGFSFWGTVGACVLAYAGMALVTYLYAIFSELLTVVVYHVRNNIPITAEKIERSNPFKDSYHTGVDSSPFIVYLFCVWLWPIGLVLLTVVNTYNILSYLFQLIRRCIKRPKWMSAEKFAEIVNLFIKEKK